MPLRLLRDPASDRRLLRSATVALALHGALVGAVLIARGAARPLAQPPEITAEIEIEPHAAPPADTPSDPVATEEATAGAVARVPDLRSDGMVTVPAREVAPRSPEREPILEAAPSASSAMTFYAPTAPNLGAIGAANPFLARGALPDAPSSGENGTSRRLGERPLEAPTKAAAEAAVNRALGESLAERSQKGLGPEGPVIHALEDATSASLAPLRGTATFVALVDGNGVVTDVKLLEHSGEPSGWEDARARAAASLKGKKLAMGGKAGGDGPRAELRIAVSSDVVLPSGTSTGSLPIGVGATPTGAAMSFDLADLSGKARRSVHARLTSIRER